MNLLRRFLAELHRRAVWRAVAIYTGSAWFVYQVILALVQGLNLPGALPVLAIVLFLVGLPIVFVTAFVQGGRNVRSAYAHVPPDAAEGTMPARVFTWRNAFIGGVAALALWGVVAAAMMVTGRTDLVRFAKLDDAGRRAIAVLPFTNMAGDSNLYFVDGVHEDVLTQMAFISDLAVTSRTSVERFRNTTLDTRNIAKQLAVKYIVEGSVRRQGDRVRIVAQLIDASSDTHLWAETYDRQLNDVFAIQSEVATAIAHALQARLAPAERHRVETAPTSNTEAYDLYLRARALGRGDPQTLERGIELTRAALDLDARFAPAWAWLGSLYGQRMQVAAMGPEWADSGAAAARRAIDIAPDRPEGYKELSLNLMLLGRTDEARMQLMRAIELNPSYAEAMQNLGVAELRAGRHDQAVLWLERARRLSPGNVWVLVALSETYAELGMWPEVDGVLASAPNTPEALLLRATTLHMPVMRGQRERAFANARAAVALAPNHPWVLAEAIVTAQMAGQAREALPWAERLYKIAPNFRYMDSGKTAALLLAGALQNTGQDAPRVAQLIAADEQRSKADLQKSALTLGPPMGLAEDEARRGNVAAAVGYLQQAYTRGYRSASLIEADPGYAALRNDGDFRALMARMNNDLAQSRERVREFAAARSGGRRML